MATKCLLAVLRLHLKQTLLFLILCGSSFLFVLSNSLWDIRNGLLTFYRYPPGTEEMARLEDFRRDWLRQRRARVDWQEILRPCHEYTAWGQVKNGWGKLNRSNANTSDIIFKDIRPAGEFSKISFSQEPQIIERRRLVETLGEFTYVVHQALWSLFLITIMELTKLCFSVRSLVSIKLLYILIIVFVMPLKTHHVTGSSKATSRGSFTKMGF